MYTEIRMFFTDVVRRGMHDVNDDGEHKVVIHNHRVEQGELNDSLQEFHPVIIENHCPYIVSRHEPCVYGFFCQDFPNDPAVCTLQDVYNSIAKYIEGRVNRDGPTRHGRHQSSVFRVVHCSPFVLDELQRVVALRALIEMEYIPRLQADVDYHGPIGEKALQMADMYSLGFVEDPVLSVSQSTAVDTGSSSGIGGVPVMSSVVMSSSSTGGRELSGGRGAIKSTGRAKGSKNKH